MQRGCADCGKRLWLNRVSENGRDYCIQCYMRLVHERQSEAVIKALTSRYQWPRVLAHEIECTQKGIDALRECERVYGAA